MTYEPYSTSEIKSLFNHKKRNYISATKKAKREEDREFANSIITFLIVVFFVAFAYLCVIV